jgi:hypothetical protein
MTPVTPRRSDTCPVSRRKVCVDIMQNRVYTRTEFRRQMFSHKAFSKLVLHAIVKVPTSCWGRPLASLS